MRISTLALLAPLALHGATITTSNYSAAGVSGQNTALCSAASTCDIYYQGAGVQSSIVGTATSMTIDAILRTTFDMTPRSYSAMTVLNGSIHEDYLFTDGIGQGVAQVILDRTSRADSGLPWEMTYAMTGGISRTVSYQDPSTSESVAIPFTYGQPFSVDFYFNSILRKTDSLYSHSGMGYYAASARFDMAVLHSAAMQDIVTQEAPAPVPEPSCVAMLMAALWSYHRRLRRRVENGRS